MRKLLLLASLFFTVTLFLFAGASAAEALTLYALDDVQHSEWNAQSLEEDTRLAYRPEGRGKTIKCESQSNRHSYCPTGTTGRVRLERQLSDAPCRPYATWGTDGDGSGIWVRNGCRGIFVVETYRPTYPENWWGWGRTVTCRSDHYDYNHCSLESRGRRVRLERQLSDTRCVRGSNWGEDRNGVWVNGGCAAVFSVD